MGEFSSQADGFPEAAGMAHLHTLAGGAPSSITPLVIADRASYQSTTWRKGSLLSPSMLLEAKLPALHPEISQIFWCFPLAPRNAWWNTKSARRYTCKDDWFLNEMLHCQESKQTVPQTKLLSNVDLKINYYFLLLKLRAYVIDQKNLQHNCCCHIVLSTNRSDRWLLITYKDI